MKRFLLYFAGLALLLTQSSCGYNGMVEHDQAVKSQWANVQSAYQRRADLIPQPGEHRERRRQVRAGHPHQRDGSPRQSHQRAAQRRPAHPRKHPEVSGRPKPAVGSGLGRLLAVSENYPELKANANFQELQAQIEGTENRINVERNKFNAVTNDYNTFTRSFPNNLFAGMFGFQPKALFRGRRRPRSKAPDGAVLRSL